MDQLLSYGKKVASILRKVEGSADVKVEQVTGLPVLSILLDRSALDRYGLNIADVQEVIQVHAVPYQIYGYSFQ